MMLGELEHILLSLGEKLGKLNVKGTLPPDFLLYTYCIRTFPTGYTAKTQYQKFQTNTPVKELCGYSPKSYIHVSVNHLYIPLIGLPTLLAAGKYVGRT